MKHGDVHCLLVGKYSTVSSSEENEDPLILPSSQRMVKKYRAVVFDPLDGSKSNIDVNVSIWGQPSQFYESRMMLKETTPEAWVLSTSPSFKQIAAGYVQHGSSTILVYIDRVMGFTEL